MSGARQRERRGPGAGRWILLGAAVLAAAGATFAVGVHVGRHVARPGSAADAEAPRKVPAPRRSGLVEPVVERRPEAREPLTFYQTLTAPLAPLPAPARAPSTGKPNPGEPAPVRPAPDVKPPAPAGPALTAAGEWTVQVGVFRQRRQADGLRKQLADAGVDAHIVDAHAEDGQGRHKVRVGTFKTREEAVRVAARVAAERRVPTYVTLR